MSLRTFIVFRDNNDENQNNKYFETKDSYYHTSSVVSNSVVNNNIRKAQSNFSSTDNGKVISAHNFVDIMCNDTDYNPQFHQATTGISFNEDADVNKFNLETAHLVSYCDGENDVLVCVDVIDKEDCSGSRKISDNYDIKIYNPGQQSLTELDFTNIFSKTLGNGLIISNIEKYNFEQINKQECVSKKQPDSFLGSLYKYILDSRFVYNMGNLIKQNAKGNTSTAVSMSFSHLKQVFQMFISVIPLVFHSVNLYNSLYNLFMVKFEFLRPMNNIDQINSK